MHGVPSQEVDKRRHRMPSRAETRQDIEKGLPTCHVPIMAVQPRAMSETSASTFRLDTDNWLDPMPLPSMFDRPQPLEVDVGCGKGRFLLAHARANPQCNFLGIDRMLRRIRKIDRKLVRQELSHVRLLRMEAYYAITYLVPEASVSTYYIFFPDPWPKKRHHRHRLFSPPFMDALQRTLLPGGIVHVATDHLTYAEEIKALFEVDDRFSPSPVFVPGADERTDFEQYYIERGDVGRCSFLRLPTIEHGDPPLEN